MYAGQVSTGLCPLQTFAGTTFMLLARSFRPWSRRSGTTILAPYHDEIHEHHWQLKREFGYALLWDAHSIASEVPRLFPGVLTDLNIGTNGGASCSEACESAVMEAARTSDIRPFRMADFVAASLRVTTEIRSRASTRFNWSSRNAATWIENNLSYDAGLAVKAGT